MRTDSQSLNADATRRQAGMSLTEVLVASAIFAIILIAALIAYDRSNRVFTRGVESSDLQQSTRVAFEKLLSEVRMAGFDYDRDGSPSGGEQQPDEQIEFAGVSAITIRGNLDYFTDIANNHGLESGYAVADKFETVTTANEEIVTFALRSANAARNIQQIKFYADVAVPRAAYPGGTEEALVTIGGTSPGTGYDLCDDTNGCSDPPYTLYRIALQRDGTAGTPVPIADNIHSLYFKYYTTTTQDTLATVTESGASATRISHGAVGGLGQYDPDAIGTTPNFDDRAMRGEVRSIHVELTGTTQNKYYEGLTGSAANRTYTLETLVVPRNFGHQGSEDPHLGPPSEPEIESVCTGHCGVAHVAWSPSASGSPVDHYYVCYDTNPAGAYADCIDATLNLEADVSAGLIPGTTYSFKIKAQNSEGVTWSGEYITRTIRNNTQPQLPGRFEGRSTATAVELTWSRPSSNTNTFDELVCSGGGSTDGTAIPSAERIQYTVWRSLDPNFVPGSANSEVVVSNLNNQNSTITVLDNPANKPVGTKGPAACLGYYYRIQTSDFCATNAAWNEGSNVAIATNPGYLPALADPAIGPYSITPGTPSTPNKPIGIAMDMASSSCNSGTNLCTINIDWSAVTGGTDSSILAIDTYRIKRWRQVGTDVGTRISYPIDAALPDGYEMSGALLNGETFTDSNAITGTTPQPPLKSDGSGNDYTYFYTVEAKNCTVFGEPSDEVKYPTCYFDLTTMSATGALTGTGAAGNEWVLAQGDKLTVTHPTRTLTEVVFNVTAPNGTSLTGYPFTDTTAPFEITWNNMVDGTVYTVSTSVRDSLGCIQSPTLTRYVKDQSPALCYPEVNSTTWGPAALLSGQVDTRTVTFNIKNESPLEDMTITAITFTLANSSNCPDNGNLEIDGISWSGTVDGTDRTTFTTYSDIAIPGAAPSTVTRNTGVNPAYPLAFILKYRGDRCTDVSAGTNPITSLCISYTLPSEPGVTKKCNVIGTETNNPNSCN